ncbi:MAG TPA: dTDP-4-dehydrorhamnose 3,5-epimerase [Candidatus Thermoplasmatota archaeon]|nr:dTDP-4-dehydrorhamnose 3,5-epimerase [Candidatus Thermoplasmatota archaeon]
MPFDFKRFDDLPDVILIEPRAFADDRGWFMETYKRSEFVKHGIPTDFVQDNHSRSTAKGTIRGLHYQKNPTAQGKLVRAVVGGIFDVAVDIRKGSPTFGRWVSAELTAENRRMLWVPPGFAHGICTITDVAEIMYKVTAEYNAADDRGIRWNDPTLGIRWPTATPHLSKKDAEAPLLDAAENNFAWEGPK